MQVLNSAVLLLMLQLMTVPAVANLAGKTPSPDTLGIRLSMSQKEAHARLKSKGNLEKEARKRQEVWSLSDRRVSHLIVGFDPDYKVRYVTAIARKDGPPIRYSEVGDLETAEQTSIQGNVRYTWKITPRPGKPAYIVVAHGRDPLQLESYSVKRLDTEEID